VKYLIYCLLIISSVTTHGTAFTLGDGITWKNICMGVHDELDEKSAIASCTMLLLGYQAGAIEQSRISKTPVSLCKSFNPNTLPKEFVAFVNSNKKYEKMDVLGVLLEFTKGNACGI
jgi:hypothetical protein